MTKKEIKMAKSSLRAWKKEIEQHKYDWDDPVKMFLGVQALENYIKYLEAFESHV